MRLWDLGGGARLGRQSSTSLQMDKPHSGGGDACQPRGGPPPGHTQEGLQPLGTTSKNCIFSPDSREKKPPRDFEDIVPSLCLQKQEKQKKNPCGRVLPSISKSRKINFKPRPPIGKFREAGKVKQTGFLIVPSRTCKPIFVYC